MTQPMTRRAALHGILCSLGLTLLAACGAPQPAAAPTTPPAAPTTPPAAPAASNPTSAPPAGTVAVQGTPTTAPTSVPQAQGKPAASQPKSGGTLRLGMTGDISTLDGHNTTP